MADTNPDAVKDDERECLMCERVWKVIKKVGPLLIKEPCPNNCSTGYVRVTHTGAPETSK